MRVLLVCHGFPPVGVAGVERLSAQTATGLAARGHYMTVLTRRPTAAPPTLALEQESRDGIEVTWIVGGGDKRGRFPGHEPQLEQIFERMLVERLPDVVLVTHLLHHSPGYVAIAHRWRIPVVLELHDFFAICPRAHLQRPTGELCEGPEDGAACARHCFQHDREAELRWALRARSFREAVEAADSVLAPSRFVADAIAPLRGKAAPVAVVDNPVADHGPALSAPRDPAAPLHLASIGVTVEHKGFQVVVEALRRARLPAARYSIFGRVAHPLDRDLHALAGEVPGLELRVFGEFEPHHLPALLTDADAVVVPSLVAETFSIVTREAFACGLPVIASRIGALADAIRPGENGWLFPPGDASALAALLQQLDGDRERLRAAAAAAGQTEVVSVADRAGRIEALLRDVVARGVERPPEGRELLLMRDALARSDADHARRLR